MKFAILEISEWAAQFNCLCARPNVLTLLLELVLSILIPAFEFLSCPEEIDWRLGITVGPYVKGKEEAGPSVPIRVRRIAA